MAQEPGFYSVRRHREVRRLLFYTLIGREIGSFSPARVMSLPNLHFLSPLRTRTSIAASLRDFSEQPTHIGRSYCPLPSTQQLHLPLLRLPNLTPRPIKPTSNYLF